MPGDFDLVKERVEIVQLIGETVHLKKAGRAYVGLCPFHVEKTPSFHVDPERRTYKCFGCGEGGDIFTWLEKQRGLSPAEALTELAERAGVELKRRAPEERKFEDRLFEANDRAFFYFREALRKTPRGQTVAEYLAKRGITEESIDAFGIG
jgi:DNA primase